MFKLDFRIVPCDYDDFYGENGFFQMRFNDYSYGEMYPMKMETIMDKVSLYDWFERLAKVIKYLATRNYVALSDTESIDVWIEFRKNCGEVSVSVVKALKEDGSRDIEFKLKGVKKGKWENQKVHFVQLKREVAGKGMEYIKKIDVDDSRKDLVEKMKLLFSEIV